MGANEANWDRIIDEHARLLQFHDNMENLYHRTIGNHESTINIHEVGDLLLKVGEIKEVDIIE